MQPRTASKICAQTAWHIVKSNVAVFTVGIRSGLKYQLCILKSDESRDWSMERRFGFVVINLEKSKTYPVNFVCILPLRVNSNFKTSFEQRFGTESTEVAKKLLTDALVTEEDEDAKNEIGRRLKLLEPERLIQRTCVSCGKTFQAKKKQFRKRYCEDCLKKKFGGRQ
jgi:hypothetical protein